MNKKFSTLVASALLALGSLSATAAITPANLTQGTDKIEEGRYYLLKAGSDYLTATAAGDSVKALALVSTANLDSINHQLWSFEIKVVSGSNRFVITNKATGQTLSFDSETASKTAGTMGDAWQLGTSTEWTWLLNPETGVNAAANLTCAFTTDSTLFLMKDVTTNGIYAVKEKNPITGTPLTIQAQTAGNYVLTPADLNILGTGANKYFTLTSKKTNLILDAFKDKKYQAQYIHTSLTTDPAKFEYKAGTNSSQQIAIDGTDGFVALNLIENNKPSFKYLHVDTAYHTATGLNADTLFIVKTSAKADTTMNGTSIATVDTLGHGLKNEAFMFKVIKNLYTDSAFVVVKKASTKTAAATTINNKVTFWNGTAAVYDTISSILLTANTEVFTLYKNSKPENLLFKLGEPSVDDPRSSEKDGVYFIRNKAGQYLAAPIYNDSIAKWVTVKPAEQDPSLMPAYQWVALTKEKPSATDARKAVSQLILVNREFTRIADTIQLYKENGASYKYADLINALAGNAGLATTDSIQFTAVPAEALSDSLLGYKNFEAEELLVKKYTFNFLHPYATDKYINVNKEDSLVSVLNGTGRFKLEAGTIATYGVTVDAALKARIPGLKQLYRNSYVPSIGTGNGTMYLNYNSQDQYYMATSVASSNAANFYFKANNYYQPEDALEKQEYHALVAINKPMGDDAVSKAGVMDDDMDAVLKHQLVTSPITSAFKIAPDESLLYRRFDNVDLEGNEGDAADTLRFVEKYRGELFQIENNPNFIVKGIDFLGIYTPDKAASGLSFIVDTAWVGRGQGYIKPQYLISIEREDQKFEAGEMCPVCQEIVANGGTRPANCPHDKAGVAPFHLGKYLVNFTDSVANAQDKASYAWKGYTRVGFVRAAHMGDSLYILKDQFADVTLASFDTAKIHKAVADNKYAAKNIIDLTGDNHKLATWSMRYVDPSNATQNPEFLVESMKKAGDEDIAPIYAAWLKNQNGCLVLSDSNRSKFDEFTQGDDALIFDVKYVKGDEIATDNETIATSEVAVIAGEGQVRIANAAGKKVVITNILGQTVANTVITSDNAIIAAPQGVIVVAVEGEEAVKAIVK